eukprot:951987-Prorocentrum_minimum.AAC.3
MNRYEASPAPFQPENVSITVAASDVPVELLETPSNMAIMSVSPPSPENGNFCLATYRCQETSNRIEIKMRAVEGHFGTVQEEVKGSSSSTNEATRARRVHQALTTTLHHWRIRFPPTFFAGENPTDSRGIRLENAPASPRMIGAEDENGPLASY